LGIITIIILLASSFGILKTVLGFMSLDITVSTLKWAGWESRNLKRLYSNSFLELEQSFNTIEALRVLDSPEFIVAIPRQSRTFQAKKSSNLRQTLPHRFHFHVHYKYSVQLIFGLSINPFI
jgi:hypothetical protein